MTRILFVDDEPHILEGLRDALRPQRREWQMTFAASGAEAVALLDREPFDVVVSDMRMPGVDGATVLAYAKEAQPAAARIVLSGQAERAMALRAARVAHLFLAKPCELRELRGAVLRTLRVRELLQDDGLRRTTAGCGTLPTVPAIYAELTDALHAPDADAHTVAAIASRDVAMSAKLLQLVNSAFFGLGRTVTSVAEAVAYLGMDAVRLLALSTSAFDAFGASERLEHLSLDALQRHSLLVARIAARVAGAPPPPELVAAGMLHDIGKLVLASNDAEYDRGAPGGGSAASHADDLARRERSHAEVGAYLLDLWGLPLPIVEAVADHHGPPRLTDGRLQGAAVLYVADGLAHELDPDDDASLSHPALDDRALAALGLRDRLPGWRTAAAEEARALAAGASPC